LIGQKINIDLLVIHVLEGCHYQLEEESKFLWVASLRGYLFDVLRGEISSPKLTSEFLLSFYEQPLVCRIKSSDLHLLDCNQVLNLKIDEKI